MELHNPRVVRELMARHGLRFSRALGQNFIVNPAVCPRIAELSGAREGVCALEIGPGAGVLTAELARRASRVVAVEIDVRLLPLLGETMAGFPNVEVVRGDILKLDVAALLRECAPGMPVVVCANLPYYITTPILTAMLEAGLPGVESYTFMMQREVAQRVCAPMPSRAGGALTALVHYHTEPRLAFTVGAGSFLPPPDVDSAVVRLRVREHPPVAVRDERALFRVVRGAFGQRRKTVHNALAAALGLGKQEARGLLDRAGVDPGARAEQLSLEQFAAIANALTEG